VNTSIQPAIENAPTPYATPEIASSALIASYVIAPTAMERAAMTVEPGPYAVVSNGKATAAEFGKAHGQCKYRGIGKWTF
jgi:hypothetical protein